MGALKIDVFNTSFTIKASEDDSYLEKLLGYYKKIISQIQKSGTLSNPLQISALAGVMLCDELYKEKSKNQMISKDTAKNTLENQQKIENEAKAERITLEMIEKISKVL